MIIEFKSSTKYDYCSILYENIHKYYFDAFSNELVSSESGLRIYERYIAGYPFNRVNDAIFYGVNTYDIMMPIFESFRERFIK